MLNPQNWLENTYSDKKNTTLIDFDRGKLEFNQGELIINNYPNLEIIWTTGEGKIKNIAKLTINNCPQLVEINVADWVDNQELTINNCPNLTELRCDNNQLTKLDISNCWDLAILYCYENQLTNLKFVQQLTKLETLVIYSNSITTGLEYLPLSLKVFECDWGEKIWNELALYGKNLRAWQQAHPELMNNDLSLTNLTLTEQNTTPLIVTATPNYLLDRIRKAKAITSDESPTSFSYSGFALRDNHPLAWERENQEVATSLPLRLYNFETKQVVTTANSKDIPHYLALSYVWGTEWEKQPQTYGQDYQTDLTKLGHKALNKAIATWKVIKQDSITSINYIWIDNFCINQSDPAEKGQEVKNQKQYYNNATATLIAVDGEILQQGEWSDLWTKHIIKQIVISSWFTRSWTFQEGLLSKQTIFMFDDGLVDGRILAKIWTGLQDSKTLNHTTIFSTPLGWSYGATKDHSIKLSLSQALDAVKHRKQTVALDGLYSILGLLPYGKQATVNYENNTPEQVLQELMDLARQENPYEVISWFGERRDDKFWTIPQIKEDGSTNVEGFMNIAAQPQSLQITEQGILLAGWNSDNLSKEYVIIFPNSEQIVSDKLFQILVPKLEYSHLPIKVTKSAYRNIFNDKIFIDMINKQVVEGGQAIAEYQTQIEILPK